MKPLGASLLCLFLLAAPALAGGSVDYTRDVKPILAKHCTACHGPQKQTSGLRLDTAAAALKGGISGPALVAGSSKDSNLLKALHGRDDFKRMPPKDPRPSAAEIAIIARWIDEGAKAPANETTAEVRPKSTHWAFQPVVRPAEPAIKDVRWVRNPIDRFILARLEKEGIKPSPEADRVTLIRRVSLDLTGLPPTPAEVEAFLKDPRPDAYEKLVDRLLSSPHYGERWGRHWLDLARYADSNGFNIDAPRTIWPYRDWVIDAFNRDLPFDQFTLRQIAGDLLPGATRADRVATGFHRNTLLNQEGGIDLEQFRVESIVDRVNTTGAVYLGLTIGCAQCHDHKYDPISQREYYELFAFLNNADEPNLPLPTPEQEALSKKLKAQIAKLQKSLQGLDTTSPERQAAWEKSLTPQQRLKLPAAIREILDVPDYQRTKAQKQKLAEAIRRADEARHIAGELGKAVGGTHLMPPAEVSQALHLSLYRAAVEKQIAALKKQEPQIVATMVLQERAKPRETHVLIKGDFLRKGVRVLPDVPGVLHPLHAHGWHPVGAEKRNRLDLARWLIDPNNPLTPRVTMNRFWQQYFGTGLVETENDFGSQGTPPSHPELLHWLASEFIVRGWSMKAMHRLIVTSAAYRQSSKARPELATLDPRNRLLARQSRLRLEAEAVRDVTLAASGLLSPKIGGPSVFPPQPEGVFRFTQVQRDWVASLGPDRYRRGLYTHFWRSAPHPALIVFDAPESTSTCTRRNRSNTPLQALTLLNDSAFFEAAQALAARVLREVKSSDAERIRHAFRLCLARSPSSREQERLERLLADVLDGLQASPEEAKTLLRGNVPAGTDHVQLATWTMVARVLLNLDEFITRE